MDTKEALRPVLCLANPSAMQGARWTSRGIRRMHLRASDARRMAFALKGEWLGRKSRL